MVGSTGYSFLWRSISCSVPRLLFLVDLWCQFLCLWVWLRLFWWRCVYRFPPVLGLRCDVSVAIVTLVSGSVWVALVDLILVNLSIFLIWPVIILNNLIGSMASSVLPDGIRFVSSRKKSYLSSTVFFLTSFRITIAVALWFLTWFIFLLCLLIIFYILIKVVHYTMYDTVWDLIYNDCHDTSCLPICWCSCWCCTKEYFIETILIKDVFHWLANIPV